MKNSFEILPIVLQLFTTLTAIATFAFDFYKYKKGGFEKSLTASNNINSPITSSFNTTNNNYTQNTTNNNVITPVNNPISNTVSADPSLENAKLALLTSLFLVSAVLAFTFNHIIVLILSVLSSIYLIRLIYLSTNGVFSHNNSLALLSQGIVLSIISISGFFVYPPIKIFPTAPVITQVTASSLIDWFIDTLTYFFKTIWDTTSIVTMFPSFYLIFRLLAFALLLTTFLNKLKLRTLEKDISIFSTHPSKYFSKFILYAFAITVFMHLNLIYFNILAPIISKISFFLSN